MTPDNLLRFFDDTTNIAAVGTASNYDVKSTSIDLLASKNLAIGQPMFLRVAPSRGVTPTPGGATASLITLRGSDTPYAFLDTATAITPNTPAGAFTKAAHGLAAGSAVKFTGTITGVTNGLTYYVTNDANLTTNTFKISSSRALALAGNSDVAPSSAGTSPTINFVSTVLAAVMQHDADPAGPLTINTAFFPSVTVFASSSSQVRPLLAPVRPLIYSVGQADGMTSPVRSGCRYLTCYLQNTFAGQAITDFRLNVDLVVGVPDGERNYYPSGITHGIS